MYVQTSLGQSCPSVKGKTLVVLYPISLCEITGWWALKVLIFKDLKITTTKYLELGHNFNETAFGNLPTCKT